MNKTKDTLVGLSDEMSSWVEDGRVIGTADVTMSRAVELIGDDGFLGKTDEEILEAAGADREIFGYLYGSCEVSMWMGWVLGA